MLKILNTNSFQHSCPVIYIDTETTGMNSATVEHRIIEIALVKVPDIYSFDKRIIFHTYLNIEDHIEISKGSFMVHGISREQLKGKPKFEDVANKILDFVEGCLIIGHNVQFDIDFVNASLSRIDGIRHKKLLNKTIDSRMVAAQRFPGSKVGLDHLIEKVLKLPKRGNHSALDDALYLAEIYPKLQKEEKLGLFDNKDAEEDCVTDSEDLCFFDEIIGEEAA